MTVLCAALQRSKAMFAVRKTFELAVCLLGYWIGKGYGGWGAGIILAFCGLYATSYGWDLVMRRAAPSLKSPTPTMNFTYGAISSLVIIAASFVLWGK